jgi:hypothetical protein
MQDYAITDTKIREVTDFAGFLLSKTDDKITLTGIHKLTSDSKSFDFLKDDESLYSLIGLK